MKVFRIITNVAMFIAGYALSCAALFGQDGYEGHRHGETLTEEQARIDAQKTRFAYIPQHNGPMFDGVCRLSVDGKQWSGVAISSTQILTVGHHGETGIVRAEFVGLKSDDSIGISAKILKTHKLADLSLLEYKCPSWAAVRSYPVSRKQFKRVKIRGFTSDILRELDVDLLRSDTVVDGFKVHTFKGKAWSGMSGSGALADGETVGIQFGGNRDSIDAVTVETIQMFLKE